MVKIVGIVFILLGCALYSHEYRIGLKKGIASLEDYIELVESIRAQIEYFSTPLAQILRKHEKGIGKTTEDVLTAIENDTILIEAERKVLIELFSRLGDGYKDEQIKLCVYSLEQLKKFHEKRAREYPEKVKVNRSLCFLAGASAVLLLL